MTILNSIISLNSISKSNKNNKIISLNSNYISSNINNISRLPPGEASYFNVPDEWIKNYNASVADVQGPTSC